MRQPANFYRGKEPPGRKMGTNQLFDTRPNPAYHEADLGALRHKLKKIRANLSLFVVRDLIKLIQEDNGYAGLALTKEF